MSRLYFYPAMISFVAVATLASRAAAQSTAPAAASALASEDSREWAELQRFRSMLVGLAAAQGASDLDKLLLMPTPEMLHPSAAALAATTPESTNAALVQQAQTLGADTLYAHTLASTVPTPIDIPALYQGHGPATLIIVPGIFGEFISGYPLQEAFTGPSSFANTYQNRLNKVQDQGYSLSALGPVTFNLGDRVHLGGIDGEDGAPHVQALYLQPAFGSMESLGANADNAAIFLQRLSKVFATMPLAACQNIYLVGYSQGTDVVLEMLTQGLAAPQTYPFLRQVKGILTLSGVLYGTEVADDAYYNAQSATYKTITSLQTTLAGLQLATSNQSFLSATGEVIQDWDALMSLSRSQAGQPANPPPMGETREDLSGGELDPLKALDILHQTLTDIFKVGLTPADSLANLQRLKIVLSKVFEGTKGLSTPSRLAWWSSHTLPTNIPVYSLATSMPDASSTTYTSPLLTSPYYGTATFDYQQLLRPGFYSLAGLVPGAANDSQVLTLKERIYPALISHWNPAQAAFPTHFLGVLGTHHWGTAFPTVLNTAGGAANPYPRRALTEAIGAFLLAPND